jgi:hypothetical protein
MKQDSLNELLQTQQITTVEDEDFLTEADSEGSQAYNQPTPGESGSDNTKLADSILVPTITLLIS